MTEAGRHRRPASSLPVVCILAMVLAVVSACGGDDDGTASPSASPTSSPGLRTPSASETIGEALRPITLRLRGALGTDAAGYVAAVEQGYYEAVGLDVTIVPGDPDGPMPGGDGGAGDAEFVISWVPAVLIAREREGSDLVDIAQIAQRSGTLSLAFREAGITEPADLAERRLGILAANSEPEILAAAGDAGVPADDSLTTLTVGPTVSAFLAGEVPATQALIYDGYAQVLEATDPDTGKPYQTTDLDVINYTDYGTAMLQDAIFASEPWLAEEGNEDLAVSFLAASFRGWAACRDDPSTCVDQTHEAAQAAAAAAPEATLDPSASPSPGASSDASERPILSLEPVPVPGRGHLAWMLNEYHPLVWPAPEGIGIVDTEAWATTVEVLLEHGFLSATPADEAVRMDLAQAALDELADLDTTGVSFEKGSVDITPGGE